MTRTFTWGYLLDFVESFSHLGCKWKSKQSSFMPIMGLYSSQLVLGGMKPPNHQIWVWGAMRPPNHQNGDGWWWMTKLECTIFTFGMLLGTFQGTENKEKLLFKIYVLILLCWVDQLFFSPCRKKGKKHDFAYFYQTCKRPPNVNVMLWPLQNTSK